LIVPDDDEEFEIERGYSLFDFESGRMVKMPAFTPDVVGTDIVAISNAQTTVIYCQGSIVADMFDLPPRRPWLRQFGLAAAIFAVPGWWCWRGKRQKA